MSNFIPTDRKTDYLLGLCAAVVAVLGAAPAAWAQGVPLKERLLLCAGCHNPDGNSTIAEYPRLAAQDAAYLERQMADLKSGKRKSAVMLGIIGMVDAKEFAGLAAYFNEQKPKAPAAVAAAAVKAGKEIYDEGITDTAVPACSGCHNEDGSGTDKYPRLAGQHAPYVVQQLLNFKSGERDNDARGVMRAVAKRMTEAQMRSVAQYIASMGEGEK